LRSTSQQKSITSSRQQAAGERQSSQAAQRRQSSPTPSHIAVSPFIAAQRSQIDGNFGPAIQPKVKNQTGLPDNLKSGVESLSGMSMDAVRVHYNSGQPAQMNAHAFAQGTDIHVAPGQEQHLPHEAWHVVQQAQGRVRPTLQMKSGVPVNDDKGLEQEADVMGQRASAASRQGGDLTTQAVQRKAHQAASIVQLGKKNKSTGKARKERKEKKKELALDRGIRSAQHEESPADAEALESFGNEHRDVDVDIHVTGEGGVALTGTRPDDAPVVERFRRVYSQLDNLAIYLEHNHPEEYVKAEEKFGMGRRREIVRAVKAKTKEYKEKFRDLDNLDIDADSNDFELFVEEQAAEIQNIARLVQGYMTSKLHTDPKEIQGEGEEIWKEKWLKAVLQINTILSHLWPDTQKTLNAWITKQKGIKAKYPVGKLTYIGSLAKGYKGPPKQHIRFDVSDFDVDANVDAPSLAEYAMRHDKLTPDRGGIFSRNTTIRPLIEFADAAQKEMVTRVDGIQDNPDDLFDVKIDANETLEQQEEQRGLLAAYAERDQRAGQIQ
jgi:Domain of unknown function (DUF4157)